MMLYTRPTVRARSCRIILSVRELTRAHVCPIMHVTHDTPRRPSQHLEIATGGMKAVRRRRRQCGRCAQPYESVHVHGLADAQAWRATQAAGRLSPHMWTSTQLPPLTHARIPHAVLRKWSYGGLRRPGRAHDQFVQRAEKAVTCTRVGGTSRSAAQRRCTPEGMSRSCVRVPLRGTRPVALPIGLGTCTCASAHAPVARVRHMRPEILIDPIRNVRVPFSLEVLWQSEHVLSHIRNSAQGCARLRAAVFDVCFEPAQALRAYAIARAAHAQSPQCTK